MSVNEQNKDGGAYRPLISILVPVYNVEPAILQACIDSVLAQTYMNWQLCMVDDHSTVPEMAQILHRYDTDPRFRIRYRAENGHIARATNDAMQMAEGEFIAFLDCDDVLCEDALQVMADRLAENPELDFLYSDEDKLTEDGSALCCPFYKPDWSPDYFLNIMYTCHFSLYRREIALRIGGIPYGCDGAQDYAFTLRFTEETTPDRIAHIPQILYHWRLRVGSIAENPEAKPYAQTGVIKAKTDALARRGLAGEVEWIPDNYQYRVNYTCDPWPLVSVIVLSKDHPKVLERCLFSIREKTDYPAYELLVVDNGSSTENRAAYEELCAGMDASYIYEKMPFNFSKSCNLGARYAKGELLLFLNDDTEVRTPVWMRRMAGQAMLPHAGAVGAKLLYPGGQRIQHVGVVSLESGPGHAYGGADDTQVFDYGINRSDYNALAVTGACLMVRRDRFDAVGGWDERFPEAYNDVDLCMRLYEAGWFNVVRNDAVLTHYESFTRGSDVLQPAKKASMQEAWRLLYALHPQFRGHDPFYNPAYNPVTADYALLPERKTAEVHTVSGMPRAKRKNADRNAHGDGVRSVPYIAGDAVKAGAREYVQTSNLHFALDQGLGGIGIVGPREVMSVRGWAYLEDTFYLRKDAPAAAAVRKAGGGTAGNCPPVGKQQVVVLLLKNGAPAYRIDAEMADRPDVKQAFRLTAARVGFSVDFSAAVLVPGGYGLGLGIDCGGVTHWAPLGQFFFYVKNAAAELSESLEAAAAGLPRPAELPVAVNSDRLYVGVCCHKPSYVPENPYLHPIHVGAALADSPLAGMQPDDTGEQISAKNPHYCELTAHYWMWKNLALRPDAPEWLGLFHYRRYLSFSDARYPADAEGQIAADCMDADTLARFGISAAQMERVLRSGSDLLLPEPYDVRNGDALTVRELYAKNHAPGDLSCMEEVIRARWPQYVPAMEHYLDGTRNLACSMFVMRRALFLEYSAFLFDVLGEVERKRQAALEDYSAYNARIYGFLGERLLGIYSEAVIRGDAGRADAPVLPDSAGGHTGLHAEERGAGTESGPDSAERSAVSYLQRVRFAYTDAAVPAPRPSGGFPVVFSTDDGYARYTAVSLASLLRTAGPEAHLDILILHAGLSRGGRRILMETAGWELRNKTDACDALGKGAGIKGAGTVSNEGAGASVPESASDAADQTRLCAGAISVRLCDVSWALRRMRHRGLPYPVTAPMFPLLLGELLPGYGQVLCLDSDVLVRRDICELQDVLPEGSAAAGAANVDVITVHNRYNPPLLSQWQERAGGRSLRRWIQPGVLLLNLTQWRQQVTMADVFEAFSHFPPGHETEAVNLLGEAPPAVLDFCWNLQQPDNFAVLVGPREGAIAALSVSETAAYRKAVSSPGILHFSGRDKPWTRTGGLWADRWWRIARDLPCYESLLRDVLKEMPMPGCEGTPIPAAAIEPENEEVCGGTEGMQMEAGENRFPHRGTDSAAAGAAGQGTPGLQERPAGIRRRAKEELKRVLPPSAIEALKKLR